jgi:hypothetical protein
MAGGNEMAKMKVKKYNESVASESEEENEANKKMAKKKEMYNG